VRILVVDDSISVQEAVRDAFREDTGVDVTACGDVREAEASLIARPADVVLCDVVLPGPSGYDLCRRLKEELGDGAPAVLLLTSAFEPFSAEQARASGADGIVGKPFTGEELRRRVHAISGSIPGATRGDRTEAPGADPAARIRRAEAEAAVLPAIRDEDVIIDLAALPAGQAAVPQATELVEALARRLAEPVCERLVRELSSGALERVLVTTLREMAERLIRQRIEDLERDLSPGSGNASPLP
jgi:DNA-binding response OmpR family regulator